MFYGEGYDPFLSSRDQASAFAMLYRFVRRFTVARKAARIARGIPSGGKCLDVGCATGELLAALNGRGFDVRGVEPDAQAAEYARTAQGVTIWTGTIHDVPDAEKPFDLIVLWHVLEHVPDLRGNLARLHDLLRAGGRLAIAVPNPLSRDARIYGSEWVAWDTPRHLYHFEPPVMLALLGQMGFVARHAGAVAFDAFYHSLLSERGGAFRFLRAGGHGLSSYLQGIFGGHGSSELYFATKRAT
ncbi:MAG: class I SAM-dependent methyltransferase [bacterium]|nr:class I SAM-dependent methyltransferase [bacterium]